MKYIQHSMYQMKDKNYENVKEENISIVERILMKTGNPKMAAVLALDLFLVGVDTVSILSFVSIAECCRYVVCVFCYLYNCWNNLIYKLYDVIT